MEQNDFVRTRLNEDFPDEIINSSSTINSNDFSKASLFSLTYYKQFFNIDSQEVLNRILITINPKENKNLLNISPDLYGPIWISISVSFFSMFFGKISSFTKNNELNFNLGNFLMNIILCGFFTFILPLIYKYLLININLPSIFSLITLFGYSLILILPNSLICLIVGKKADWVFSLIGGCFSGYLLFKKLNLNFNDLNEKKKSFIPNLLCSIILCLIFLFIQLLSH